MVKIVFVAECRITNKDQSIEKEKYVEFNNLYSAKVFITRGLNKWDGSGLKGISVGQVREEERNYNNSLIPTDFVVVRFRVYSPLKKGWFVYDWVKVD